MKNYLDRYLAGEAPLHPERLELPTDEELYAAEAEFDQLMAERESQTVMEDKTRGRVIHLWPWAAAAACVLLLIGVLSPPYGPRGDFITKQDVCSPLGSEGRSLIGKNSRDSVQKKETVPVVPLETVDSIKKLKEKYRMPRPPKHYMAKAEASEPEPIDETKLAEMTVTEEIRWMEIEMKIQTSGSLQADFKAMTDEIRSRGERMTQQVEIAMSEE